MKSETKYMTSRFLSIFLFPVDSCTTEQITLEVYIC